MRLVRSLRDNPVVVLCAVVFAFVIWLLSDATAEPAPVTARMEPTQEILPTDPMQTLVMPPRTPRETAQILPRLKPGMTRAEVEGLVGVPASEYAIATDHSTYGMRYAADLAPPTPEVHSPLLVTLEFDAAKPGHPLLGIHYPDPLF